MRNTPRKRLMVFRHIGDFVSQQEHPTCFPSSRGLAAELHELLLKKKTGRRPLQSFFLRRQWRWWHHSPQCPNLTGNIWHFMTLFHFWYFKFILPIIIKHFYKSNTLKAVHLKKTGWCRPYCWCRGDLSGAPPRHQPRSAWLSSGWPQHHCLSLHTLQTQRGAWAFVDFNLALFKGSGATKWNQATTTFIISICEFPARTCHNYLIRKTNLQHSVDRDTAGASPELYWHPPHPPSQWRLVLMAFPSSSKGDGFPSPHLGSDTLKSSKYRIANHQQRSMNSGWTVMVTNIVQYPDQKMCSPHITLTREELQDILSCTWPRETFRLHDVHVLLHSFWICLIGRQWWVFIWTRFSCLKTKLLLNQKPAGSLIVFKTVTFWMLQNRCCCWIWKHHNGSDRCCHYLFLTAWSMRSTTNPNNTNITGGRRRISPQLPISIWGDLTLVQKLKWLVFTDWSWHRLCTLHAVRVVEVHARCWMNRYLPENTAPLLSIAAEDVACLTATHRWRKHNKDLLFLDILAKSTRSQITAT